MDIVHPDVERYIAQTEAQPHPVLRKMEEHAEKKDFPIVGPQVGRLLSILCRTSAAQQVLELGSGFGYSAFWFALALPQHGKVTCTELSAENRDHGIAYLEEAGLSEKVVYHLKDGLQLCRELLESHEEGFDILFNDIDKEHYADVPPLAKRLLRPGGLFITDNTIWGGKVTEVDDPSNADEATAGVLGLNNATAHDPDFETSILPIRDGLTIAVRR
jgi:predicted O-methyltransferase YrrM